MNSVDFHYKGTKITLRRTLGAPTWHAQIHFPEGPVDIYPPARLSAADAKKAVKTYIDGGKR